MSTLNFEGRQYTTTTDESLLEALLRQGAEVPHSCRRGSCHTCVLKIESGAVTLSRQIDPMLTAGGYTLACIAHSADDCLSARRVRADELGVDAELLARRRLSVDTYALDLAPIRTMQYRAGQFVQIQAADGEQRPYSIANRDCDDFFLTVHVRRIANGRVSTWLCDHLQPGQRLRLNGPFGNCCFDRTSMLERPMRMLASGSAGGALAAVAREALELGHRAGITLFHGLRHASDGYLDAEMRQLEQRFPSFRYLPCVSVAGELAGDFCRRVVAAAFKETLPADAEIFLCGLPTMVEDARYRARLAGVPVLRIHADPFDFAQPPAPRDAEKIRGISADPEIWTALEQGPRLTRILDAFYTEVYADPRLSPYFQRVPKARAIQKQYEFLASTFSGCGAYFGLNPFNAHHWMVISDELFDHRESLFERVLQQERLAPHLIDRWMALHELFRTEIVKLAPRGMISQGIEQPLRVHSSEYLEIDTVCDACGAAIPAGQPSRYIFRIGALHCASCAGISVPASLKATAVPS